MPFDRPVTKTLAASFAKFSENTKGRPIWFEWGGGRGGAAADTRQSDGN